MIEYIIATKADMEQLMQSRLEMIRGVNHLPMDYIFSVTIQSP